METGPPTRSQPQSIQNDGWRKITLTVPNSKISNEIDKDDIPIAPPRRKRSSIVVDHQPCGFKELFGNNVSRRSSCDSILNDNFLTERDHERFQYRRKSKSFSEFNLSEVYSANEGFAIHTIRIPVTRTLSLMERAMVKHTSIATPRPILQRKISRVGNKKSDRFFGENLSDCLSDEPISPETPVTEISLTYESLNALLPVANNNNNNNSNNNNSIDVRGEVNEFIDDNAADIQIDNKNSAETNTNTTANGNNSIKILPQSNVTNAMHQIDDKKTGLDKKAEFLMAMLEDDGLYKSIDEPKIIIPPRRSHSKRKSIEHVIVNGKGEDVVDQKIVSATNVEVINKIENVNDEEYYKSKGMMPVEEPIIIPRRRQTKHICDDDHHMHNKHMHTERKQSIEHDEQQVETKDATNEIAKAKQIANVDAVVSSPAKPKRDFSIYEKSIQTNPVILAPNTNGDVVEKPVPRVRHLSQENLMPNKFVLPKSSDTIDLLRLKSKLKNQNNNKMNGDEQLEFILKKYNSQQSFLTQELMDQIADRVYGFQDPFEVNDNSCDCEDGSSKYTPQSKLTERKISAHRKESTVTRIPEIDIENEKHPDDVPAPITMKIDAVANKHNSNLTNFVEINGFDNNSSLEQIENFILMERQNSEVFDKQIKNNNNNNNAQNTFIQPEISITNENKATNNGSDENHIQNAIHKTQNANSNELNIDANGNEHIQHCDKLSDNLTNISDDDNTGSDITVREVIIAKNPLICEKEQIVKNGENDERRDSIVTVDQWFLKHNDLSESPRRGSENNTAYNTRKIFPFGKTEADIESAAFFESKTLSKSVDDIHNINNNNNNEQNFEFKSTTPVEITSAPEDHSILLKYLK